MKNIQTFGWTVECDFLWILFQLHQSPQSTTTSYQFPTLASMLIDSMQSDAERAQVGVAEKITGLVADRAKPCVAKAIDYTLLVVLLLLQFMRCTPATSQQIIDGVSNGTFNTTSTATSIYSCDLTGNTSLLFSSTTASSLFIITAVAIALIIGIFYSVFVWVHAHKLEEVTIHPWTDKLYKCTSKIIILDTFIEIPISFYLVSRVF